jgi:hypothetical protein
MSGACDVNRKVAPPCHAIGPLANFFSGDRLAATPRTLASQAGLRSIVAPRPDNFASMFS